MSKRKTYQKPEIKQVDLVPEEALLLGCKLTSTIYTGGPTNCYKNVNFKCSASGS